MFKQMALISLLASVLSQPALADPMYVVSGDQVVYSATPIARLSVHQGTTCVSGGRAYTSYAAPMIAAPSSYSYGAPVMAVSMGYPAAAQVIQAPVVYPYAAQPVALQSGFSYGSPVIHTQPGYFNGVTHLSQPGWFGNPAQTVFTY